MSAQGYFAGSDHEFINRLIVLLRQNSSNCLKCQYFQKEKEGKGKSTIQTFT